MLEVYAIVQCLTFTEPKYNGCQVVYGYGMFSDIDTCKYKVDHIQDRSANVNPSISHFCASKTVHTWKKVE